MISVDELLYEFELKLNVLDREENQKIFTENKLIYLNSAQISWIKSKLNQNNIYKIGYEGFRKRIEDLQVLKINNKKLKVSTNDNIRFPSVKSKLSELPEYMFYISSYVKVNECNATLSANLIKEGELESLYFNEHYKPSLEWRETLCTMGDNNIYVYTVPSFTIKELYVTYLRNPKKINKEGHIMLDGNPSVNQDCELPYYAKDDIVDLAVKFAAQSTNNQIQAQFAKEREINNE